VGDALRQKAGGDAAGLEDDDFSGDGIEEELGDLGGFAGACGGAEDEGWGRGEEGEEFLAEGEDGEIGGVHCVSIRIMGRDRVFNISVAGVLWRTPTRRRRHFDAIIHSP